MSSKASARPEQTTDNTESAPRKFGPCTPASVLSFLHDRNEDYDEDELRFLSKATDAASFMSNQLAQAVSAMGCVISWDYQPGKPRAGNFENGDTVAQLLFVIADQVGVISELTAIGDQAYFALLNPEGRNV